MKKILILNGQYWPGYKGGGPIQSCMNMVENLSDKFEFLILTADRDYKEDVPYVNVKINEWIKIGSIKVFYMSPNMQSLKGFQKILNKIDYDILYLNGFFSPIFTIKPLILKRLGTMKKREIIITPRGDFTGGCENKKTKKFIYIFLCKLIGLYSDLLWHATSNLEEKDIKLKFKNAKTIVVPNLPAKYTQKSPVIDKVPGELRLVFVSRVFPKKNLKFALEVLMNVTSGNIIFDVYGPMEDKGYWNECLMVIKELPSNVTVTYKGEVEHKDIGHVFESYHAFFFPTFGENYGHVIIEAMMNNCLVILSKGVTPWDDYNGNGGFVNSLNDYAAFLKVINLLISYNQKEIDNLYKLNSEYVNKKLDTPGVISRYINAFS
jgi:glycosyltransferase involved in cell wall biosynthesis